MEKVRYPDILGIMEPREEEREGVSLPRGAFAAPKLGKVAYSQWFIST